VIDIGVFAAMAFNEPQAWNGKAVGLAGDEISFTQLNLAFLNATGQPAPVAFSVLGSALTAVIKELRLMLGWFASDGYKASVADRRKQHPGLLTMEAWLATKSDFKKKATTG
jgi:hypothetical protein